MFFGEEWHVHVRDVVVMSGSVVSKPVIGSQSQR